MYSIVGYNNVEQQEGSAYRMFIGSRAIKRYLNVDTNVVVQLYWSRKHVKIKIKLFRFNLGFQLGSNNKLKLKV